jgi:hypothetical protein
VKARDAYRLIVKRSGIAPAMFADPQRVDHVEIVEIDSGEVVLFWDLTPHEATRRARAVRQELGQLSPEEFLARWATVDQ